MGFRNEMREDFGVAFFIMAMLSVIVSFALAIIAFVGFFIRGCVPTITAAGDKFAKSAVESMGEDFEEHSWKIDKKDGGKERAKKDDQNETSKNIEQDSAGLEGA